MSSPVAFLLACLVLLAAPGPTNVLLAMAGAGQGGKAAARLIPVAVSGYLISVLLIGLLLGPRLQQAPGAGLWLKGLCALYLVWLAVKLWRQGSASLILQGPVRARAVFTTTLLNPKALILALVIVPHLKTGHLVPALPYLLGLAALIATSGLAWTGLGAALNAGGDGPLSGGLVRRGGATALMLFALALGGSVWAALAGP